MNAAARAIFPIAAVVADAEAEAAWVEELSAAVVALRTFCVSCAWSALAALAAMTDASAVTEGRTFLLVNHR
ncbi:MAG: hypothetical protein AAGD22_06690 [Verrucomicrobiota bacterium]